MADEGKEYLYDSNGNRTHEVRNSGDLWEEVIDLQTGKSTLKTHKLEKSLSPEGCSHDFRAINIGTREAECLKCNIGVTFVIGQTVKIDGDSTQVEYHGKYYPLSL